jgi:hypothetical protein
VVFIKTEMNVGVLRKHGISATIRIFKEDITLQI